MIFVDILNHNFLPSEVYKNSLDKIISKKMTRGEDFMEERNCNHGQSSPMSSSASCDLNSKGDFLRLHDKKPSVKKTVKTGNFHS